MKNIELLSLTLRNFKGIKELTINFNRETSICGRNATGKTTIADAFYWLFFGKDSTDRKDFEIKTLDANNQVLHGLEHSVIGVISINGKKKTFQKIFQEKWEKPRGKADKVFTGNKIEYKINDDPKKESEYKAEINEIIDEMMFKLITNPLYFSSGIEWSKRRNILMGFNGHITPDMVINYDSTLEPLRELLVDKSLEELKKSLKAKRTKLNDENEKIPVRIDECNRSIKELDFTSLKSELTLKQTRFENVEAQLLNNSVDTTDSKKTERITKRKEIRAKIDKMERDVDDLKYKREKAADDKVKKAQDSLKDLQEKIKDKKPKLQKLKTDKTAHESQIKKYREEFAAEQAKEFSLPSNEQFICPTCGRLLETEDIEKRKTEMLENFNSNKAKILAGINTKGKEEKEKLTRVDASIDELEKSINELEQDIESAKQNVQIAQGDLNRLKDTVYEFGPEYKQLKEEYESIEKELDTPSEASKQLQQLTDEKKELQVKIDEIKAQLRQEEINSKQRARIEELSAQERLIAQQIADVEKEQFLCEQYVKTQSELLESEINAKFKIVRWKLFNTLINGAIEDCCEALVNGVPFADLNHAGKINAGIDIINCLSNHYGVTAPLFLDNREAVNEIIPTEAQVINLIVSTNKELIIL